MPCHPSEGVHDEVSCRRGAGIVIPEVLGEAQVRPIGQQALKCRVPRRPLLPLLTDHLERRGLQQQLPARDQRIECLAQYQHRVGPAEDVELAEYQHRQAKPGSVAGRSDVLEQVAAAEIFTFRGLRSVGYRGGREIDAQARMPKSGQAARVQPWSAC